MKYPQEMAAEASAEMASKLEAEIADALNDFWGAWSIFDLKRRCQIIRCAGNEVETLYADGVPLLEIHPMTVSHEHTKTGVTVRCRRDVRRLQKKKPA